MHKSLLCWVTISILVCSLFSLTCYALTEEEVQAAVDANGKESVSGNVLVWFLCAIAFMKVSQKIDSFMSSLGITVGRTGGSMMTEAMIIGRTIGSAFKSGGKLAGFGKSGTAVGSIPAGKGGIFGSIGRKMTDGAAGSVTGNGTGGMMTSIGKRMYENSVGKSGAFAAEVIGSVARGEISKMGTISGTNGKAAMESYFGYNASASVDKKEGSSSLLSIEQGGSTNINESVDINSHDMGFGGESIPTFSDVEMGGGRITGMETSIEHPDGIRFAMYDAEKYTKPEGVYETVTAVDNSRWYKQYAAPAVERTPYMDTAGKVQYNEKIVERIPKAPIRKDKM